MPANALAEMVAAIPDRQIASIVRELRLGPAQPSSMTKPVATEPPKVIGKHGWLDERKLEPPPGISLIDQMCEAADRKERRCR